MKLLHLANDFALSENETLLTSSQIIVLPKSRYNEEKTRYTPVVALLILLVFAGFTLTIPLHPSRSAVPNGCSTTETLPAGQTAAACILQATGNNSPKIAVKGGGEASSNTGPLVNSQVISVEYGKTFYLERSESIP